MESGKRYVSGGSGAPVVQLRAVRQVFWLGQKLMDSDSYRKKLYISGGSGVPVVQLRAVRQVFPAMAKADGFR